MKFNGVLFDVDGTLTSTNQLIFDSFNHIVGKYLGKKFSDEEIISYFGPPEETIIEEIIPSNFIKQATKDYYKFYEDHHKRLAKLFNGMDECIKLVKNSKLPLGIFTGKGKLTTRITLEQLGLANMFDIVITGDDVVNHKPAGEGITKFSEAFKLNPNDILMIGDSPSDVQASREVGNKIASVLWDSYAEDEVVSLKPDYTFYKVDELKEFLNKHIQ